MDYPGSHSRAAWQAALALLCCAGPVQAHPTQQIQQTQAPQAAREQGAATQGQNRKTESANRAAAVEDETSAAAQAARTTQSETAQFEANSRRNGATGAAAPSYGPVLRPRGQQAQDPARKDPAEVHDETDSLSRQTQPQPPSQARQPARQTASPTLRHPAWQPAGEPMAPRPLRSADGVTPALVPPVPVPATPPRPVVPSTAIIGSCQGSACTDTGGNRINGIGSGNAGVSGSGRLCTRTGTSVQCF